MKQTFIAIGVFVAVLWLSTSLYTINETEQVIITSFGKPVGLAKIEAGLHMKVPFIQTVNSFEKRWLEWSGEPSSIVTKDKKLLMLETYTRWRVKDPLLFFQTLKDERSAQSRLDDIVEGETRNVIANNDLIEIVRTTDRKFTVAEDNTNMGEAEATGPITNGRPKIVQAVLDRARPIVATYGIELVDVQVKRVNYGGDVQQKVFDRMISERKRIAERSRSEGQGKAAEIRGQKERDLKGIQSDAYRKAQELMGKADGEATRIYAEAYNRDPELYQFLKTMETYRKTFATDTTLILSTEGEFFKYLKQSR